MEPITAVVLEMDMNAMAKTDQWMVPAGGPWDVKA
jgi:hypothetical protein